MLEIPLMISIEGVFDRGNGAVLTSSHCVCIYLLLSTLRSTCIPSAAIVVNSGGRDGPEGMN